MPMRDVCIKMFYVSCQCVFLLRLEVITQQKINGLSMFQNQQVSDSCTVKLPKGAFTQFTLPDPSQRNEHKTTRQSSCESDQHQGGQFAKNDVELQNQGASCQQEDQSDDKSIQNGFNSNLNTDIKNKKRTVDKCVDQNDRNVTASRNQELHSSIIKGSWTKQQDRELIRLVGQNGAKNWSAIAKKLKGRMGKQCRERWHNHLNPDIKKQKWTEEQDRKIIQYHQRFGNRWALISRYLPGRTDNAIKNHWNSTISRKLAQQNIHKKLESQGQQMMLTPIKPRNQEQWKIKTAGTSNGYETPAKSDKKYTQFFGSIPVNLFSRKKIEQQQKKQAIETKDQNKIGLIIPVFNKCETNSNLLLEKIQGLLQIQNFMY